MPAQEIKELRVSGKLKEAFQMAIAEYEASPDNIWAKRNLAWVYHAKLKQVQGTVPVFLSLLTEVLALEIPHDEQLLYEQLFWVVGMHNFKIAKTERSNQEKLVAMRDVLELMRPLPVPPSSGCSFLLKSFHNQFKPAKTAEGFVNSTEQDLARNYLAVFQWAGFDCFLQEDFEPNEINGKKTLSFVEQVINVYSKYLLQRESIEGPNGVAQMRINEEKIDHFFMFLDEVLITYPSYQYAVFYKSKLLLALKRYEEARHFVISFVKKKERDFWVWELLSETYPEDIDIQIACLCKALSLKTQESFLVKVHQKLAGLLVQKERYTAASTAICNAIRIREKKGWNINSDLVHYTQQEWFEKEVDRKAHTAFYKEQALVAEELLYHSIEALDVVVSFVNREKKLISFVKNKNMQGFFSYKQLNMSFKIGDLLQVRLEKVEDKGFYRVRTIERSEKREAEALREVVGNFRAIPNQDFGFVDAVFVAPELIKASQLQDGDEVVCKSILSFDKKKNQWGWRALGMKRG